MRDCRARSHTHHPLSANPNECAASLARQWQPCCVLPQGLPSGLVQHANERARGAAVQIKSRAGLRAKARSASPNSVWKGT
jgi:hypothetical protein